MWDRSFLVLLDASNYAVEACLAQNFDCENGGGGTEEHTIAYVSQKFTDSQRNWAVIENETYAIIWALKTFDPII